MSPEAQRIAIAETCGWKFGQMSDSPEECWHSPDGKTAHGFMLPHYTRDLNAMHEAEKALTQEQACDFVNELCHAADARGFSESSHATYRLIHATTAQRAEAFLRTIGKWSDAS